MEEMKATLSGEIDQSEKVQWELSSNVLCNYMKKQEYLDLVLNNQAIVPRYVIEPLDYLGLGNLQKICFPMTCFCDIPFSKISTHMSHYGEYGIGLDKESALKRYGIQPIHYINECSPLGKDFSDAFRKYNNPNIKVNAADEILLDYLLTTLLYMKPIQRHEKDKDDNLVTHVYQDECEWRFIPKILSTTRLPLILHPNETNDKAREVYSSTLLRHDECWLKFSWEDVRYIIVPNELSVFHTINTIKKLDIDEGEKDFLISKIEVSKRIIENS